MFFQYLMKLKVKNINQKEMHLHVKKFNEGKHPNSDATINHKIKYQKHKVFLN